jgi:hypothetical protein
MQTDDSRECLRSRVSLLACHQEDGMQVDDLQHGRGRASCTSTSTHALDWLFLFSHTLALTLTASVHFWPARRGPPVARSALSCHCHAAAFTPACSQTDRMQHAESHQPWGRKNGAPRRGTSVADRDWYPYSSCEHGANCSLPRTGWSWQYMLNVCVLALLRRSLWGPIRPTPEAAI